ncbi:MAG: hydrogenase formation protein HypD [Bacteroidota bacterium]|jgi:hydrogenase expression/formation protein HypD|nr:hydrogenase formation protein HypD [Bacteroidota bacterium]
MNLLSSFRDSARARPIIERIHRRKTGPVTIMEFCGGHTVAIFRSGMREVLPSRVRMLSGPGCPVCVTSNADLDRAIALARTPGVILASYGDMLRVPGSHLSLMQARAQGCHVEIVYSTLDALALAEQHPDKDVVFFAIGFETTAPAAAAAVLQARARGLKNFSLCSVMKLTIPGARALLGMGDVNVDAVIGPGHVSSIIGADPWRFLPDEHGIPVAISGFEPLDLLAATDALLGMIETGSPDLVNTYRRIVKPEGNRKAWGLVQEVFAPRTTVWRGFGEIPDSGLVLREEYAEFDAERRFSIVVDDATEHPACRCGEVLRGVITPPDCAVFATACTPEHPLGPCMVSSEGSCAAYFQYQRHSGA